MERFRPVITRNHNFIDPLTASLNETTSEFVGNTEKFQNHAVTHQELNTPLQRKVTEELDGATVVFPCSSYNEEWFHVSQKATIDDLKNYAVNGDLRSCRFRSICWRRFLKTLAGEHTQWLRPLRERREKYEQLRMKVLVNPSSECDLSDPSVNNPLSQHEQSPWNQYFEDSELKRIIRQDVLRSFQEVEFFQCSRIRDMITTVLFCFARDHPSISYRQGMHEILAPLVFVLHCDQQAHRSAMELEPSPTLLMELMDEAYLEHDSFELFEAVMRALEPWYEVSNRMSPDTKSAVVDPQPFAKPQDAGSAGALSQRLASIQDGLLKRYEPELYLHLMKLEIAPQLYGIRWLRLLFGREFVLHDLLMVWDVIFSGGFPDFPMVDCLTVAMLSFIRDKLLAGDYSACLSHLMKYPVTADTQYIIHLALHYRAPKTCPHPSGLGSGLPCDVRGSLLATSTMTEEPSLGAQSGSLSRHYRSSSAHDANRCSLPRVQVDRQNVVNFTKRGGPDVANDAKAASVINGLGRISEKFTRPRACSPVNTTKGLSRSQSAHVHRGRELKTVTGKGSPFKMSNYSHEVPPVSGQLQDGQLGRPVDMPFSEDTFQDLTAICIGCGSKLSHFKTKLSERLVELGIDEDPSLQVAVEGIGEVIEALSAVRDGAGQLQAKGAACAEAKPACEGVNLRASPAISHPLEMSE